MQLLLFLLILSDECNLAETPFCQLNKELYLSSFGWTRYCAAAGELIAKLHKVW
jgi:hypothetical protein